jgi:predicted RNase H-like HicB family nuclease
MFTAILKKSGPWWIGWIEEVPGVNCQEKTKEELIASLKTALKEAFDIYRSEARKEAGTDFETELIAL